MSSGVTCSRAKAASQPALLFDSNWRHPGTSIMFGGSERIRTYQLPIVPDESNNGAETTSECLLSSGARLIFGQREHFVGVGARVRHLEQITRHRNCNLAASELVVGGLEKALHL